MLGLRPVLIGSAVGIVLVMLAVPDRPTTPRDPVPVMHADEPPPGVDVTRKPSVRELAESTGLLGNGNDTASSTGASHVPPGDPAISGLDSHLAPSCSGTGVDGNRVQVVYAVEQGKSDRYSSLLPSIRSWVADVDDTIALSARKTGAEMRVRWVHKDCVPEIVHEVLPAGALRGGFQSMISELKARGYTDKSRKYLVFADSADLCGFAQMYRDTRKVNNYNDGRYPMFARVDSPCWAYREGWHSVAAHEVMHNLGAVQPEAPHANPPGVHCTDERDTMCYEDGSGARMQSVCPPSHEQLFDCRDNDYFHTRPPAGSYLSQHWNTADSSFLDDISRHPTTISATASPRTVIWGTATTIEGTVVRADGHAPVAGHAVKLLWRENSASTWGAVESVTTNSAGEYSFSVHPLSTGEYLTRLVPQTPEYSRSTSPISAVTVRYAVSGEFSVPVTVRGISATLAGSVAPDHAGDEVYLQLHDGESWQTQARATLDSRSRYSFPVNQTSPGAYHYRAYAPGDSDHAAGWTPQRTLTVL